MCDAALDHVSVRNGLASVSWLWVGAVALIVALVVVGLNYWRNQPQPVAVVSTATPTTWLAVMVAICRIPPSSKTIGAQ